MTAALAMTASRGGRAHGASSPPRPGEPSSSCPPPDAPSPSALRLSDACFYPVANVTHARRSTHGAFHIHVTQFCPAELADTGPVTAGGPFCTVRLLQIRKAIRPAGMQVALAGVPRPQLPSCHCRSLAHHLGTTRRQK
jgi:hypothetical protein